MPASHSARETEEPPTPWCLLLRLVLGVAGVLLLRPWCLLLRLVLGVAGVLLLQVLVRPAGVAGVLLRLRLRLRPL